MHTRTEGHTCTHAQVCTHIQYPVAKLGPKKSGRITPWVLEYLRTFGRDEEEQKNWETD